MAEINAEEGIVRQTWAGVTKGADMRRSGYQLTPVCTENLNPDVVVMKSAKDGMRPDASGPLNGSRDRCIFGQRPVGSNVVVIASVGSQDPAQMRLA